MTTRMVGWYFLASIVATMSAVLVKDESRWEAIVSGILTTALWLGSAFVAYVGPFQLQSFPGT